MNGKIKKCNVINSLRTKKNFLKFRDEKKSEANFRYKLSFIY